MDYRRRVLISTLPIAVSLCVLTTHAFGELLAERSPSMDHEDFWRKESINALSLQEPSQDSLNVRRVGRGMFEPLEVFCIDNDTCYVISGKDIVLYDVSDKTSPELISSHRIDLINVWNVHSEGSYLYLMTWGAGFWKLDKQDGFRPVGSYTVPGLLMSNSYIEDDRAYITCDYNIHIVDITGSGDLELLGVYDLNRGIAMAHVTGDTCYIACGSYGLMVLDVSDPSGIVELDSLRLDDGALRLTVQDSVAYTYGQSKLIATNVKDPTDIFEIGSLPLGYASVENMATSPPPGGYLAFTEWYGGFHLLNVSDPGNMFEIGSYPVGYPTDAGYSFPYAFVTNEAGLRIIDFSTPEEPELTGFLDGDYAIYDVSGSGEYCYLADYDNGFLVVDAGHPSRPEIIGSYNIHRAHDAEIDYPFAYVASDSSGFFILDIGDPDSITQKGHIDIDARGVFINYPYAYLAVDGAAHDGLRVLDVSRPDSIVRLDLYDIPITDDVYVDNNIAYVASSFDGVYLVDVSDPESLSYISRVPTYDMVTDVHVSGHYLYMAAGYAGVSAIDVSDPYNPVEVSYSLSGYGNEIYVVEPYLYLAGGSYGLRVLDISVPEEMHEAGYYGKASMGGIYADEDYIYLGTLDAGFYIFEFTPVGIVPIGDGSDGPALPRTFALSQNYPNPFNPQTTIAFDVPEGAETVHVRLSIYDVRGRLVKTLVDTDTPPGSHCVVWDGTDENGSPVGSGVYLSSLEASGFSSKRKLVLVR